MPEQTAKPTGTGKVRPRQEPISALGQHAPWMPVTCGPEVVGAFQALRRGDALGHQQTLALNWILEMTKNGGALYFPGDAGRRDTDFALGRLWVGQQIGTLLNAKLKRSSEHG
tara:strand:+ start:289 stop:627 length:339 start_codon:yes stop_codon:yes gene_type:complete